MPGGAVAPQHVAPWSFRDIYLHRSRPLVGGALVAAGRGVAAGRLYMYMYIPAYIYIYIYYCLPAELLHANSGILPVPDVRAGAAQEGPVASAAELFVSARDQQDAKEAASPWQCACGGRVKYAALTLWGDFSWTTSGAFFRARAFCAGSHFPSR